MPDLIKKPTQDAFKRLITTLGFEMNYRNSFASAGIEGVGFRYGILNGDPPTKYLSGRADEHIDCYYRGISWNDIRSIKKVFRVWEEAIQIGQHSHSTLVYSAVQLLNLDGFIFRNDRIGVLGKPAFIYEEIDKLNHAP